ncbi:alanine racemase [Gracilimonas sp.]|uniref:alanine racemase n=1 Tax=Gracilimonas sp. TaxID=1974203 RepID=UPI002871EB3B|nr:alanine racemase [Gracilimonas sp.]
MKPFPTLHLDTNICRNNIQKMNEKADRNSVEFRPHFKTHQSKKVGRMFRDVGVNSITVSSIKMAEYFIEDGWKDVTIAFPANILAIDSYNQIASKCDLKTLVISKEVVKKLDAGLSESVGLYIEIDPDYGRSGIPVGDFQKIRDVLDAISAAENMYTAGFYCHAGHTYKARSRNEVLDIAGKTLKKLTLLKEEFPDLPICYGDTPSCSVFDDFGPLDQISPGNFVFYDWMQVEIGACSPNDIAVSMECPVIEKFEERHQVLIHGGAIHFSKDFVEIDGTVSFGEPKLKHLSKDTFVKSVSQEHGLIQCSPQVFDDITIGQTIEIFPIHSCLTADLMREYHTENGSVADHMNGV